MPASLCLAVAISELGKGCGRIQLRVSLLKAALRLDISAQLRGRKAPSACSKAGCCCSHPLLQAGRQGRQHWPATALAIAPIDSGGSCNRGTASPSQRRGKQKCKSESELKDPPLCLLRGLAFSPLGSVPGRSPSFTPCPARPAASH